MSFIHAFRLMPGDDLMKKIKEHVQIHNIKAGWICCGVGSLTEYNIRFANNSSGSKGSGYFEIVSLTGTVSINGYHIHISISDQAGKTIGGHLLEQCFIYTTAEIVLQESKELIFTRAVDGSTPWAELMVSYY